MQVQQTSGLPSGQTQMHANAALVQPGFQGPMQFTANPVPTAQMGINQGPMFSPPAKIPKTYAGQFLSHSAR